MWMKYHSLAVLQLLSYNAKVSLNLIFIETASFSFNLCRFIYTLRNIHLYVFFISGTILLIECLQITLTALNEEAFITFDL